MLIIHFIRTIKQIQKLDEIDNYGNSVKSMTLIDPGEPISDELFEFKSVREASFANLVDEEIWLIARTRIDYHVKE